MKIVRKPPATAAALSTFLSLAEQQIMLRWLLLDGYMQNEWTKPREYSFTNAAGEVFHEIAYSRKDVNIFAKMHKATNYKPTEILQSANHRSQIDLNDTAIL
jgi:hypothetical protein